MATSINQLVRDALTAVHSYNDAVAKIKAQLKGSVDPVTVRATLLPHVAGFYKVALVPKERGEGVTMDTESPKFEAAKSAIRRLVADVTGKSANQSADVAVPRALDKAVYALLSQYTKAQIRAALNMYE